MDINNIKFFNNIDKNILNKVDLKNKKYIKGQTVYNQGQTCKGMDVILSGGLVAYSLGQNGSESIVFEFKEGRVIGSNLLFNDMTSYPMNIYCIEDCELIHILKSEVEILLHDYNFVMNFIKSISINSQGMNKKIAMYTQKSLRENLMDYLSALSVEQNSKTIRLPISKKQLADYFGVQRPSLFRELKKMKDDGLIEIDNRSIKLNFLD